MDPRSTFPMHFHPEVQLMVTLRGSLDQGIMNAFHHTSGVSRDAFHIPGGMVHSAKVGDLGADALDVFWPVRPDHLGAASKQRDVYHAVIPQHANRRESPPALRLVKVRRG